MAEAALLLLKISGIIIGVICIIGNVLVCHIIVRLKSMKTSMNYIILNLAILDAITGFFAIFFVMANDNKGILVPPVLQQAYNQSSTLSEVLCRIEWSFWFGGAVSPLLLTAMAFERHKAIVHPLSALGGGTKTRLKWILALSWLSGLGSYLIDMITVRYDSKKGICTSRNYPWFSVKAYFMVYAIGMYIIPSIAMVIFYLRAINALKRPVDMLSSQREAHEARTKARKRVLKVAILVTCIFYACCGIPHTLFGFNELFGFFAVVRNDLLWGSTSLAVTFNSAINPFIYFLLIKSFRDGFRRVFHYKREIVGSNFSAVSFSQRSVSFERTTVDSCQEQQPELLAVRPASESLDFKC